tara:strand:+ start:668 stop:1003 length:336 start_codon:yes stop_codon:yes gene_type:complete
MMDEIDKTPLRTNTSIKLQETGGPAQQKMARIGEDMFGIPGYMDSSGQFSDGICQPCEYEKYLTYKLINDATGVGAACVLFFPCWGFELMVCKILPQWSTCLVTTCSGGAV